MQRLHYFLIPFLLLTLLGAGTVQAQTTYRVSGYVYDSSRNYPLEAVSVISSSGHGTITNKDGRYTIEVLEKDSIWFSYLGKPTIKFPVLKIANTNEFDISLHVSVTTLKEVTIRPRNYRLDSIQNRADYAKVFNYQKPKLKTVTPQIGVGAGFDLDEIINMFRFKRNRSMLSFQRRLLQEERDKFVDHRFNKALVRRLTMLTGEALDSFMVMFRPSYLFTQQAGDYEFQYYIKQCLYRYVHNLGPLPEMKLEEEEE